MVTSQRGVVCDVRAEGAWQPGNLSPGSGAGILQQGRWLSGDALHK